MKSATVTYNPINSVLPLELNSSRVDARGVIEMYERAETIERKRESETGTMRHIDKEIMVESKREGEQRVSSWRIYEMAILI